jgi:hypothetical protein
VCREVPDAHLCFAGEEDDIGLHEFGVLNTGYVAWLEGQAAGLGLADAITFTGPLLGEELAGLYAAADVVVSASVYHRENGGLAPAEAQACGVPVVCTAWGGFKDVVQDGETGYLMDAVLTGHGIRVDWATGAARTVALLRDPTRRAAMGARAATRARERYGLAAFSRALAGIVAGAGTPASPPPGGARPDGAGTSDARGEAYAPSAFAARLEAHKRAAGWYGPRPGARRGRRVVPGMFQGRDYRLYERLMEPYATRPAAGLEAGAIAPDWVPYFPSPVTLDHDRALAQDDDPIWPHRRFCRPDVWAVLCRVDGAASVGEIAAAGAGCPGGVERRGRRRRGPAARPPGGRRPPRTAPPRGLRAVPARRGQRVISAPIH